MKPSDMPSPGYLSNGHALRSEAYRAISAARIQADLTKNTTDTGKVLRDFFLACADACPLPDVPKKGKETK